MAEVAAKPSRETLTSLLWSPGSPSSLKTWAILDCARDERIFATINPSYQEKCCLFAGELSPELRKNAPHLVELDATDRLTRYLLDHGWGNAWGVFVRSSVSMETLRRHFKTFLRVTDTRGRRLLFRFFDPRVLRVYLPTCLPAELKTMFGPVDAFLLEGEETNQLIEFRLSGERLVTNVSRITQTVTNAQIQV